MIKNILQVLENTAQRLPESIALKDDSISVNFAQYVAEAKSIGSFLSQKVKDNYSRPIIVMVDRRVEPIIAFMGVLYSGNFYVPVDNRTPLERLKNIVQVLNPLSVIGFSKIGSYHD